MATSTERRTRLTRTLLAACLLLLTACQSAEDVADEQITSPVSAFDLELDHPEDLRLQSQSDRFVEFCFEAEQNTQHPRCMQLIDADEPVEGTNLQTLDLDGGGTFSYVLDCATDSNGTTEHSLKGQLTVGDQIIFVAANANEEAGFEDATWPLPLIRTIRQ